MKNTSMLVAILNQDVPATKYVLDAARKEYAALVAVAKTATNLHASIYSMDEEGELKNFQELDKALETLKGARNL